MWISFQPADTSFSAGSDLRLKGYIPKDWLPYEFFTGRYMFEHGITSSIAEAFEKYIGDDCRYFVPREKISPQMAVKFILDYHGVPVLAHPYQYKLTPSGLDALIALLTNSGSAWG